MNMQEFVFALKKISEIGAVYYVIQLIRCGIVSCAVFAVICFLRKTVLKNSIFLKSALWTLLIPVLFAGRMKFYYESRIGFLLFTSWTSICIRHVWLCWLYLCGALASVCLLFRKRRRLIKRVVRLEKWEAAGAPGAFGGRLRNRFASVYVTDLPVTPFAVGVIRPKIVVPRVMLEQYEKAELHMILLHEKVHIRLGHLLCYLGWDILRALLWINPLFTFCAGYFREDLEAVCDWVTIRNSGQNAYAYGKLLIRSMRILQAEGEAFSVYAAFADDGKFEDIKQRIAKIARYQPYKQTAAAGTLIAGILCALGLAAGLQSVSYGRNNEMDNMFIYDESGNMVPDSSNLRQIITYDDTYVYVESDPFEELVKENRMKQHVYIVFGGYHKLPGIGGYGYSCLYENQAREKVVRIPYEKMEDQWVIKLYLML